MNRSTWIFALVVALIGGYAVYEFKSTEKKELADFESTRLTTFQESEIESVTLLWAAGKTQIKKENGEWKITEPVLDLADPASVNTLLKNITEERSDVKVGEGNEVNFELYGLKDPLGWIELSGDGRTEKLSFGMTEGYQGKKYVWLEPRNVLVMVESMTQAKLSKTSRDLRDKRIYRGDRNAIEDITLSRRKPDGSIESMQLKKDNGKWTYSSKNWATDTQEVEKYLGKIESLKVQEFILEDKNSDEAIKKYSTSKANYSIMLKSPKENYKLEFHVDRGADVYATNSERPTVFQLIKNNVADIRVDFDSFRDRRQPFEFDPAEVEQIRVETDRVKLRIVKNGDVWSATDELPKNKELNVELVPKLFEAVKELRVSKFRSEKVGEPQGEIQFLKKNGAPILNLKWGGTLPGQERLVSTNRVGDGVSVDIAKISAIPTSSLLQTKKEKDVTDEKKSESP